MIRRCVEAGLPEPEFEVGSGFVTRIWRTGHTTGKCRETIQENGGTDRGTTQERLLPSCEATPP